MRRPQSWLGGSLVVLVTVAGLVLVVPSLDGGSEPPPPALGVATEPPRWDQVLRIRDELRAAAAAGDQPVDEATLASVATAPGPYTPLGRVALPTTGLDVEFAAGVQPSVLERGPGHWPGTALPGRPGTVVLSGHRTTFTAPFGDLELLGRGDPVVLTATGASAVEYRVTATEIVPEAEYLEAILRPSADPAARELTLFACHPEGQRTHRIVVRASVPPPAEGS